MRIDVRPDHLKIIQNALRLYVPDREVVAFGSRVKWVARDTSDLDICIMGENKVDFETLAKLRDELSNSDLPYKVDVVDWASIKSDFRSIIKKKYEKIQNPVEKVNYITVREFSPFLYGKNLPEAIRNSRGSFPVYGSSGVVGTHDQALTKGPTVIIGRKGTIGKVNYSALPCWPIDTTFYVEGGSHRNIRYTYYALKSLGLENMNSDSAVPGLNRENAHAQILPRRDLKEQAEIAAVLGVLDEKIAANQQTNSVLEQMARSFYKSWFIDFLPIRDRINHTKISGLEPSMLALFPKKLLDDEKGKLPEGWEYTDLKFFSELNSESWSKRNSPPEIQYVDLSNTKWGVIESAQPLLWSNAPSRAQRILREGDTIVGTVRPANGSYAYVNRDGLTGSTGFAVLRPKASIYKEFVYLTATSEENIQRLAHLADGAAYPAVRPEIVADTIAINPGNKILSCFSQITSGIFKKISHNNNENQILAALRDALLPKLISGELSVGNIAPQIKKTVRA